MNSGVCRGSSSLINQRCGLMDRKLVQSESKIWRPCSRCWPLCIVCFLLFCFFLLKLSGGMWTVCVYRRSAEAWLSTQYSWQIHRGQRKTVCGVGALWWVGGGGAAARAVFASVPQHHFNYELLKWWITHVSWCFGANALIIGRGMEEETETRVVTLKRTFIDLWIGPYYCCHDMKVQFLLLLFSHKRLPTKCKIS